MTVIDLQESVHLIAHGIEVGNEENGEVPLFVNGELYGVYEYEYEMDELEDDIKYLLP